MKLRSDSRGMGMPGFLILVGIFGTLIWLLFQIIPFYYSYYELLGQVEAQADKALEFTDATIQKTLLKEIKSLEIPIDNPEDLKINRYAGKIVIELQYAEVLYVDLGDYGVYDLYVFPFDIHVERDL